MDHLFDLFFNDYHLFLLIQKRSSIDSFIFFFDPDFFVLYLLMNYHHYQPVEGAWTLAFLMFISLVTFMVYWMIYTFFKHHD